MRRPPSALLAIGGFGVAVAALSVMATAAVVLLAPQPPGLRISAAEAILALRSESPGFSRQSSAEPPPGVRAPMLEQTIAAGIGRSPDDVRVVWLEGVWREASRARGSASGQAATAGRETAVGETGAVVFFQRQHGQMPAGAPAAMLAGSRSPLLDMPLPAFSASVRQTDGRWLSIRPVRPWLGGWQLTVLLALAASLLLLAPVAWLFARRLTRPFRALARALDDDAVQLPDDGPRELREAAAAITAMRRRLAIETTERARMLTAIAHDLRTPLTGLRLRIETAPEPQRARMIADVERMQAMIGEVLSFARDEAAPPERVEVRALVGEILADLAAPPEVVRLSPGDAAWVTVGASSLRRAVENLVRNALEYAGSCTVHVRSVDAAVQVSVVDAGPGIPPGDRERLLRPFERGDASRNRGTGGAGLGLSIVQDFASRHRGAVTLTEADDGGVVATLSLPAA